MKNIVEKFTFSIILLLVLCITGVQIFYKTGLITPVSHSAYNNITDIKASNMYRDIKKLSLRISGHEHVTVLINGEAAQDKFDSEGNITLQVTENDIVELDLRHSSEEVTVFVSDSEPAIKTPEKGSKYFKSGGIVFLFQVKFTS